MLHVRANRLPSWRAAPPHLLPQDAACSAAHLSGCSTHRSGSCQLLMGKASLPPEVLAAHVRVPQPGSQRLPKAQERSASQDREGSEQKEENPSRFVSPPPPTQSGPISKYAKIQLKPEVGKSETMMLSIWGVTDACLLMPKGNHSTFKHFCVDLFWSCHCSIFKMHDSPASYCILKHNRILQKNTS